jgi:3-dehydroquinate synthase
MVVGLFLNMSSIQIASSSGTYGIDVGLGLFDQMDFTNSIILVDKNVEKLLPEMTSEKIVVSPNEASKTLSTCENIIIQLKEGGAVRGTHLIAIGGGYVQDIATLSASLYMRGIKWTFIPTTTMAMMDSCIGGKSSINVGNFKNLVGNFYPPSQIVVDLNFAKSLSQVDLACGLLEAVKICYARSPESFETFVNLRKAGKDIVSPKGVELVSHVLQSKKWFIENDEFDTGVRQLLNFGHTYGHALEAATEFAIPHGVAIGLGMLAALESAQIPLEGIELLLSQEIRDILRGSSDFIDRGYSSFDKEQFISAFEGDKKHTKDRFRPILSRNGRLEVVEIPREREFSLNASTSILKVMEKEID